jgi:predicted small secreted protein
LIAQTIINSTKEIKKMIINNKLMLLLVLTIASFGLCACETMGGAGRDIENAGESVQDAAN